MVSVSSFEVVLCESDVRFCRVVFACYDGLVDYTPIFRLPTTVFLGVNELLQPHASFYF